ncbi:MAG: PIN domain-containing protein [Gemmatimonadales bacterium]
MIYVDTSVALAHLLAEDRRPRDSLWHESLVSSRLLQYEVWTRINARKLGRSHGDDARNLLQRIAFIELVPPVLGRALDPFPGGASIRTLDALHLASLDFLRSLDSDIELASYDQRLVKVARKLGFTIYRL